MKLYEFNELEILPLQVFRADAKLCSYRYLLIRWDHDGPLLAQDSPDNKIGKQIRQLMRGITLRADISESLPQSGGLTTSANSLCSYSQTWSGTSYSGSPGIGTENSS